MIEPNMATMLAYLLTDAALEPHLLQKALKQAVDQSFNRISIDGDQSTNDSVLLLANGAVVWHWMRRLRNGIYLWKPCNRSVLNWR